MVQHKSLKCWQLQTYDIMIWRARLLPIWTKVQTKPLIVNTKCANVCMLCCVSISIPTNGIKLPQRDFAISRTRNVGILAINPLFLQKKNQQDMWATNLVDFRTEKIIPQILEIFFLGDKLENLVKISPTNLVDFFSRV